MNHHVSFFFFVRHWSFNHHAKHGPPGCVDRSSSSVLAGREGEQDAGEGGPKSPLPRQAVTTVAAASHREQACVAGMRELVKYRVVVREMDSTCDAPLLIWDKECYDLVGVSASSLREKCCVSKYCGNMEPEVHITDQNQEDWFWLTLKMVGFDEDESGADEVDSPNKIVLPKKARRELGDELFK
nr:replication protein A 70 kDa DNA-binding subunit B-like [Ipomoea batatas]